MMVDPNQRCVCGYRRFREERTETETAVQRWMFFEDVGGFAVSPFGYYFGVGDGAGEWGLFDVTYRVATRRVICESCRRVRSITTLGGSTVMASYTSGGYFYVLAADVGATGCYSLRFIGPSGRIYETALSTKLADPPPTIAATGAIQTTGTKPSSDVAETLLFARIPEVATGGTYTVSLVDKCCGCVVDLATVDLEGPPMILGPHDAELNGAPQIWLRGRTVAVPTSQPASASRISVPFDKCYAVAEYDARFDSLPDAQGWTHQGAGASSNYQLAEGGVVRAITSTGLSSYWEQTVTLPAAQGSAYLYAYYTLDESTGSVAGDGLDFQALYGESGFAYRGARITARRTLLKATKLDASAEQDALLGYDSFGWNAVAAGDENTNNKNIVIHQEHAKIFDNYFGTVGSAAATELVARFGDVNGVGLKASIRNVVMSSPGRFMRASFLGYTHVDAPILRLYFISDATASSDTKARILVRFGSATTDPYKFPANEVSGTLNFVSKNVVYELPLTLTGLSASTPFWFTVERDWDHVDDTLPATIHLLQATVRSA